MSVTVCYPNYFDSERYSDLAASSSNPQFPADNLKGESRRSRVWQSAGFFKVTALNKVIRFRDALAGPTKTATIVEGNYASVALFMAAVKAALEAVGASDYTVIQTAGKKFQFSSNLSGGATSFGLMGTDGAFTAREILGFNASDKYGGTITADVVRIHTEESIVIDLGMAFAPKAFALFGPRSEPIRIQQTATIRLQANATDSWDAPAFDQLLTWNEFSIWQYGKFGIATFRYWRVLIVDIDNPRGYVEISSLFLGDTLTFTRGCPQFPLSIQEVDMTESDQTLGGGSFSAVYGKTSQLGVDWRFLTNAESEQFRDMFREVGTGYWFVVCLDPNEVFSSENERYVLQVKFREAPAINYDAAGMWSSDWSLVENV